MNKLTGVSKEAAIQRVEVRINMLKTMIDEAHEKIVRVTAETTAYKEECAFALMGLNVLLKHVQASNSKEYIHMIHNLMLLDVGVFKEKKEKED